jgi:hypothetical protein
LIARRPHFECAPLQLPAAGVTTTRAIAEALNVRGIRAARGGGWHNSTVRNLLARAGG